MKQDEFLYGAKAVLVDDSGCTKLKQGQEVTLVKFVPSHQCPDSSFGFIYPDVVYFEFNGCTNSCYPYRLRRIY